MRHWLRLRQLVRTLFWRRMVERELDDELHDWVETLSEQHEARGLPPAAARHAARAEIGRVDLLKEAAYEVLNGRFVDAVALDVRHGWRGLLRAPGLTAVIVLTLALGIGASTAIFTVVHALLIEPLPYRAADRLTFVWAEASAAGYARLPLTGPELRALRAGTHTFTAFAGIWAPGTASLTDGDGGPEAVRFAYVTPDFLDVLGARAALGRTFRGDDQAGGPETPLMLGWDLFQRRFGGDRSVIGRQIELGGGRVTVVGVLPRGFRLLLPPDSAVPDDLQLLTPFWAGIEDGPQANRFLRVVGRLRPGATVAQARTEVAAATREFGDARRFTVVGLQGEGVRDVRAPVLSVFAGTGVLLLIACVNLAGLLMARAAGRARDTAVRLALGAARRRLLQQTIVESVLLTAAGAAAGIAVAFAGVRLLLMLAPSSLTRLQSSPAEPTVLAFTLGVSATWGLLLSLAPLRELLHVGEHRRLNGGRATVTTPIRHRTRAGLVAVQIALSVVLLVSAGLLARAFIRLQRVDPGFSPDGRLTFRLTVPGGRDFNGFTRALQDRLASLPGVVGVGAMSHLPYDDMPNWALPYSLEATADLLASRSADARAVAPGTLEALGAQLLEGRFLTEGDRDPHRPVVVIDELLAQRLWPGDRALGREFVTGRAGWSGPNGGPVNRVTVVGVIRHLNLRQLFNDRTPQLFVSWRLAQRNPAAFVIRGGGDAGTLAREIRAAVAGLDPRVPIYDVRPMQDYFDRARATRRFTMQLAAVFAGAALALTGIGIYGVTAYTVARRRQEFGVKRALGARPARLVRDALREAAVFALVGSATGLAAAAAAARLLRGQLEMIDPLDPLPYAAALLLIVASAVAACWIPMYRAIRVSPMDAVRGD